VLTVIEQSTRECLALLAERAFNGRRLVLVLRRWSVETPESKAPLDSY
jgi:hypothetical protein